MTDRLEHPEIKVMDRVIALRFGEVPVIALGSGLDGLRLNDFLGLGHHGQAAHGLHVFRVALTYQHGALGVLLQVVSVLGDAADQDQWMTLGIQAIWHYRTKWITRHRFG
ncbi:hypothetical protein D3C86_1912790 [compost metagenome]